MKKGDLIEIENCQYGTQILFTVCQVVGDEVSFWCEELERPVWTSVSKVRIAGRPLFPEKK